MKKSSLTKILIDWVRLFHDINLKNNGVIVIPRFSTVCGSVRTSFGDIGEKFTIGILCSKKVDLKYQNTLITPSN